MSIPKRKDVSLRATKSPPTTPEQEAFIDDLLGRMTLQEKAGQLYQVDCGAWEPREDSEIKRMLREGMVGSTIGLDGAARFIELQRIAVEESRLGIPCLVSWDVIHGFKTIFPTGIAMACAFSAEDAEAAERIAACEATASGINWIYAPMIDVTREPRWGRIAEGSGEDSYLGSVLAAARVRGFQGDDMSDPESLMASAKHYVAYGGAEAGREYNSTDMSDRTLREFYLPPFRAAVEAGVGSVMSAFNDIAGVPASGHTGLIRGVLKNEWDWSGVVVSDWHSVGELVEHGYAESNADAGRLGVLAGVDVDMESKAYFHIPELVESGKLDIAYVDDAVRRVLRAKVLLGLFDDPYRGVSVEREKRDHLREDHRAEARRIAARSIVLLKNENHALPLKREAGQSVALIGVYAGHQEETCGPWAARVDYQTCVTIEKALKEQFGEGRVHYAQGFDRREAHIDEALFDEAMKAADNSDVIVMAVGESASQSGEAHSRTCIELPECQVALFRKLKKTGKPLVVLVVSGRPMPIPEIARDADAILQCWFLGTEMGDAVADVLLGDVNPSGKLPVTIPYSTGHIPQFYNHANTGRPPDEEDRWTSKYIDSPWDPLYFFGHGLSYTSFEYSALQLPGSAAANESVEMTLRVKNTGDVAGDEIVQLYVRDAVATVVQPVKSLKGFQRVSLQPGEEKTIHFSMPANLLAFCNRDMEPILEPGPVQVMIGSSSDDIRLRGDVEVEGEPTVVEPPWGVLFTSSRVEQ